MTHLGKRFILRVEMRVELANCLLFATIRVTSADWFVLVVTASYFSPAAEDFSRLHLVVNFSHLLEVAHFSAPAPRPISHRQYSADKRADDNGLQTRPQFSFFSGRPPQRRRPPAISIGEQKKTAIRNAGHLHLSVVAARSFGSPAMPNSSPETN